MRNTRLEIVSNECIALRTWKMVLEGDVSDVTCPGQFVDIALEGKFLRRPISVSDRNEGSITLIYKVVGDGSEKMSRMAAGESLEVLEGLGNGFCADKCKGSALLVGGGVGAAPLYYLAKELLSTGRKVTVVLGFNTKSEVVLEQEFKAIGADCLIATMDGSHGTRGLVTDAMRTLDTQFDYFYTCGPKVMMKAVCEELDIPGEVSMEERMGCGCGICYGCTCHTTGGARRVCADGPVFSKEEIIW